MRMRLPKPKPNFLSVKGKWEWRINISMLFGIFTLLLLLFTGLKSWRMQPSEGSSSASTSISLRQKKFSHLVLGPAAGQGLPHRIQCQGLIALKRRPLPPFSDFSLVKERISFVIVFAIDSKSEQISYGQDISTNVMVGNMTYDKIGKSLAILNVFVDFIKVSMPKSNIFILTDSASNFPSVPSDTVVMHIPGNYSRNNLMLQRIKSYIDFLEARLSDSVSKEDQVEHLIFSDSDIAVIDDLSHVFQDYPDFDIALTFRNNKHQPLNSGLILVRGTAGGLSKAKSFLEEVLEAYKSMFSKAARMLGDQLALAWVLKSEPLLDFERFRVPKSFEAEVHRTHILFLPCALYNWTPPEGAGQFHGMHKDVKIIHFKGSRKRLMIEAWNFFKSHPGDFSDMLCLILRSGRTKYDF